MSSESRRWLVTVTLGEPRGAPEKLAHLVGVFDSVHTADRLAGFLVGCEAIRTLCIICIAENGHTKNSLFFLHPEIDNAYADTDDGAWETWAAHEKEAVIWHRHERTTYWNGATWDKLNSDVLKRYVARAVGIDERTRVSSARSVDCGRPLEQLSAPGG